MAAHPAVKLLKTSLRVFLEKFHATKTTKNSQSLHLKLDRFFLHENHKLSKKYLFIQMHGFAYHRNTSDSCRDDSNLLRITLMVVLLFQEPQRYLLKNQIALS